MRVYRCPTCKRKLRSYKLRHGRMWEAIGTYWEGGKRVERCGVCAGHGGPETAGDVLRALDKKREG